MSNVKLKILTLRVGIEMDFCLSLYKPTIFMILSSFKRPRINIVQTFNETVKTSENIKNKRQRRRHDITVNRTIETILMDRA